MTDVINILENHSALIEHGLSSLDTEQLQIAAEMIAITIKEGGKIFTIGNGASAAIASHWATDYTKGCANLNKKPKVRPQVISLASNVPLITAIGNDMGYEYIYSNQLRWLANPDDMLITISSSGNSPNIIKALEVANSMNLDTIALTGFSGGKCKEMAIVNLHVDVHEYEATEDCHQAIMHIIAKHLRKVLW